MCTGGYGMNCIATHYPLLIDSAVQQFKDEVVLSKGARTLLYEYGSKHKAEFEKALKPADQAVFDELSKGLHDRLKVARKKSRSPLLIDQDAMQQALDARPWTPGKLGSPRRRGSAPGGSGG